MGIYDDSKYEINEDLEEVHGRHLRELGNPGTWGTGEQRLAIAGCARQAGIDFRPFTRWLTRLSFREWF